MNTPGGPVRAMLPPVTVPGREAAMRPVPALGEHSAAMWAEFRAATGSGPGRFVLPPEAGPPGSGLPPEAGPPA